MTPKRFYYLMVGLAGLVFLALIGSIYFGNYLLQQQSNKLSQAKAETRAIDDQKVSLAQAKNDLAKYGELNEIAKSVVPQDKDQAKTIREINQIASASGINLSQISFQSSTLGQTGVTDKSKQPAITQVQPVPGISGVFSLEITITSGLEPVSYQKFLEFLEGLEQNRRTAHVASISISPAGSGTDVTFSLKLNAYLKP